MPGNSAIAYERVLGEVQRTITQLLEDRADEAGISDIAEESTLYGAGSGLALDSLDALDIISTLEAQFDVELADADFSSIRTVRDVALAVLREIETR